MNLNKRLDQHLLSCNQALHRFEEALDFVPDNILEVGPGRGALTQFLIDKPLTTKGVFKAVDIDARFVKELQVRFSHISSDHFLLGDFLNLDLYQLFLPGQCFAVVGNFPYGISTQILIKSIQHDKVSHILGIFQKEVALRVASPPKKKNYGMLSVWMQNFYHVEYLFDISPQSFTPSPKVYSAVIRCTRRSSPLIVGTSFFKVTKQAFAQKRKTLKNNFKSIIPLDVLSKMPFSDSRAEQLSLQDFAVLIKFLELKNSLI